LNHVFIGSFGVGFLLSLSLNLMHATETLHHSHNTAIHEAMIDFKAPSPGLKKRLKKQRMEHKSQNNNEDNDKKEEEDTTNHNKHDHDAVSLELHLGDATLSELKCDKFGGPSLDIAQEMVYWKDIPSDAPNVSPLQPTKGQPQRFMTLEPDGGGWNNTRMATESVIGLAVPYPWDGHWSCHLQRKCICWEKQTFIQRNIFPGLFSHSRKLHKSMLVWTYYP
jgi:hypothetical protein